MSKYETSRFRNVTVALNTPFDACGDIDLKAAKALTRYYINKGVKSLYVCGSTGEGFLLDHDERKKVVEAVTEEAGNEMNIIVHVGTPSSRHAAELAKHAETAGAAATSAVPCVYYRPSEESVYRHWTTITEAADLPFFIYNIPQLTGFNLSMTLFNRMLENERVAGVKNSSEPCHDILRFKEAGGKNFIVFNGPDEQYLAGRLMGADAGIGGTYGAMPELYLKLENLIRLGEIEKAQILQNKITHLIYRLCSFPSMYGACKTIIRMDGCNIGDPRLPFLPVDEKDPAIITLFNDIRATIEEWKNI
ncbi:MAG: dihydrodipicolinate synthase family protein [Niameybacter sp.]|uniref:dihydrodipicolinate synthase family protein n=1 Tax=Niameybacter sp. TaxID=2033640 RepID=UPI002FC60E17